MESNIQEALRAKDNAEKLFAVKDFAGARNYAVEAQMLCPELEGISQMATTFEIYYAAERKFGGEIDFYSILGLEPSADRSTLKKQYKKIAVLLHPDKNKTVGADGAFKLVSEAFTLLSDNAKRRSYDLKRNKQLSCGVVQTNLSSAHGAGVTGFDNCSKSLSSHNRLDTFWTVCTSCHVQYEYLRKYVNKRLSCKNCRGIFIAVETGAAPITGSFSYSPWPYAPDNGYGSHGYNGVSYIPTTSVCFSGNGVPGLHSGHGSECVSNMPFQWSSFPVPSAGAVDHNGLTANSVNVVHQANGNVSRTKVNGKHHMRNAAVDMGSNGHIGYSEPRATKLGRPAKKVKVDVHGATRNGAEEIAFKTDSEVKLSNGNGNIKYNSKISTPGETLTKRYSVAPAFDARKLLIDKARTVIRRQLEEMRLASAAAAVAVKNEKAVTEVGIVSEVACKATGLTGLDHQSELTKAVSMPITVPDSDFHDFDKDRSEECFKPKQIWALYDEEDGMPRLYCLIRQVISVKPFKVHISYLSSKTDSEFGLVNWLDSGFTKSCGNFRAFNTDILEQVNIFSHLLSREKAGRGGCVRIYPKSGDIWAVYRNWSADWNRKTPDKVRHQYEMVEVLDDYSEELGVCVTPLIKLDGFKTVYQRNTNKDTIRWIPRREMLRFSHQVPSCVLKGKATNLPDGCWDLDPAATPDELLQTVTKGQVKKPLQMENFSATPGELFQSVMEIQVEEKQTSQSENPALTPPEFLQDSNEVQVEKTPAEVLQDFNQVQVGETPIEVLRFFNEVQLGKTPIEVLQDFNEVQLDKAPIEVLQDFNEVQVDMTPIEVLQDFSEVEVDKNPTEVLQDFNEVQLDKAPVEVPQDFNEVQVDKTPIEVLQDFNEVEMDKTPTEVLQDFNEVQLDKAPIEALKDFNELQVDKTPIEVLQDYNEVEVDKTPTEVLQDFNEVQEHKTPIEVLQDFNEVEVHKTPIEVLQDFNELQLDETPFEVLQYFNDLQVDKTPLEVLQDFNEVQMEKTPREVLQDFNEVEVENPHYMESCAAGPMELLRPVADIQVNKSFPFQGERSAAAPSELLEVENEVQAEKPRQMENYAEPVMEEQFHSYQTFEAGNPELFQYLTEVHAEKAPSQARE